ncbi:hypothetical protein AKJ66_03745 [candidate division MSBL1 archaeon SCGC-AAA259E22]|uniref:Uncharacterized protein n=1 Tax=candidate division MSBL1 archaeon SCGC-AAA259E22 TaxID=1698265 RepID=A0A133UEJ7_9EURY|nr:hypothetical protein AKJ66_03745 [candidate division MSBL1 archaeon SCGC-AAA259E22]
MATLNTARPRGSVTARRIPRRGCERKGITKRGTSKSRIIENPRVFSPVALDPFSRRKAIITASIALVETEAQRNTLERRLMVF